MDYRYLLRQFFTFSLGTWINALISFFTTPLISYLFAPQEFGKAMMFSTVYNILVIIVVFGTNSSFVRFFYQVEPTERVTLFQSCLFVPSFLGVVVSSLLLIFSEQLSFMLIGDRDSTFSRLLVLALLTGIAQNFNLQSIRMRKKGLVYSAIQVVQSVSNVGFIIVCAFFFKRNFHTIILGQVVSNVVALLVGVVVDHEYWLPVRPSKRIIKEVVKYGLPFVPASIIWWLFTWMDRFALRIFSDFTQMGLYSAAFKIVSVMNLFQTGFVNFWQPVAYESYEAKKADTKFFEQMALLVSCVMFLLCGLVLISKDVIFSLLAPSYRKASQIAPFLVLMPVMGTISQITMRGIDFGKKTHWHMINTLVATFFNFVGNLILVPRVGARGAALSTGLSFLVLFIMRTKISQKFYSVNYPLRKIYICTAVVVLLCFFMTFADNLLWNILLGSIGFGVITGIYKQTIVKTISLVMLRKK